MCMCLFMLYLFYCLVHLLHDHWLEYADEIYSKELVDGVKILFRIMIVFLPLPVFWGVYEQQYSRWVLQGR